MSMFKEESYFVLVDSASDRVILLVKDNFVVLKNIANITLNSSIFLIRTKSLTRKFFLKLLILSSKKIYFKYRKEKDSFYFSPEDLSEEFQKNYRLIAYKYILISKLLWDVSVEREYLVEDFSKKDYVYLSKKAEAKEYLEKKDRGVDILDYPFIYFESKRKNITPEEVAKEILVQASFVDVNLAKSEAQRQYKLKLIAEAKTTEDLKKIATL
jgi:hypothetical protein